MLGSINRRGNYRLCSHNKIVRLEVPRTRIRLQVRAVQGKSIEEHSTIHPITPHGNQTPHTTATIHKICDKMKLDPPQVALYPSTWRVLKRTGKWMTLGAASGTAVLLIAPAIVRVLLRILPTIFFPTPASQMSYLAVSMLGLPLINALIFGYVGYRLAVVKEAIHFGIHEKLSNAVVITANDQTRGTPSYSARVERYNAQVDKLLQKYLEEAAGNVIQHRIAKSIANEVSSALRHPAHHVSREVDVHSEILQEETVSEANTRLRKLSLHHKNSLYAFSWALVVSELIAVVAVKISLG